MTPVKISVPRDDRSKLKSYACFFHGKELCRAHAHACLYEGLALLKELAELELLLEKKAKLQAAEASQPIIQQTVHPKPPATCLSLSSE